MKRYTQFKELVIDDFETDVWEHPVHKHNHFEIIYIAKGSGKHHLNQQTIPYQSGDLYLLGPEDEHEFVVDRTTRFIYVKFTNFYLDSTDVNSPTQWNMDVDLLLKSPQRRNGNILTREEDKALVLEVLNLMVAEYQKEELLGRKIIFQFFKALVLILKRNQVRETVKSSRKPSSDMIEELLEYIELNIYNPKMLTQKQIAQHFPFAANYVGVYFKNKFGTTLKKYIQDYRFNLLEQRLKNGQTSTKQLAIDFGFTDESHLHKFVKSISGKTLTDLKIELL